MKYFRLQEVYNGKMLLFLFAVSVYLPMIFTNIVSILLVLFMIVNFKKLNLSSLANNRFIIAMSILYSLVFLGFFYTIESEGVLNDLEKKLSFLILPITVCAIKINKQDMRKILALFFYSGFFFSSIAFCISLFHFINKGDFSFITNHSFSENIGLHATYLSMYLLFSMAYPLFYLKLIQRKKHKQFIILLWIIVTVYILLLSVRIVWILLFVIIIFQGIVILKNNKLLVTLFIFGIATFSISIIYFVPPLKERFKEAINYNDEYNVSGVWKHNVKEVWGGRGIRLLIWENSLDLIKNEPIIGYGSSLEVQKQLNNLYEQKKIGPLLFLMNNRGKVFNPHNQYLEESLKFGILLGGYYSLILLMFIYTFYKNRFKVGILFLTIIIGVSLTETILELNKGIVFFSFFFAILYSYLENQNTQKKNLLTL